MRIAKFVGLILLLAVLIAFPQVFPNPAITTIACLTVFYATATTGWNIFSGYTGYIALGHAAYFGIGSYAMALLCQYWRVPAGYLPFLLLPLVGLIAAGFAVPLGWISLRTRKHTFVVITIAIFFVMQPMAFNLRSITHGSTGLSLPIPSWNGQAYNAPFYYVSLALLLLALGVSWWIRNSKYGLGLLAIRDDEDRALGLGVKTGPSKMVNHPAELPSSNVVTKGALMLGLVRRLTPLRTRILSPTPMSNIDPHPGATEVGIGVNGGVGVADGKGIDVAVTTGLVMVGRGACANDGCDEKVGQSRALMNKIIMLMNIGRCLRRINASLKYG